MKLYEIENLRFSRGERFTLSIDELDIGSGEKVAFVGQNGSGKTTLLRILSFLEHPQRAGRLLFRERQVAAGFARPRGLGVLRQKPYLFRGSVRGNLAYPLRLNGIDRRAAEVRIEAALEQLDLHHLVHAPARQLSGGEQKRLALARVLVSDPDVLMLDEPVAHLDRMSRRIIEKVLERSSASLILTTHDLHFAHRVADRVLTLRHGRLSPSLPENVLSGRCVNGHLETATGLQITLPPGQAAAGDRRTVMVDPRNVVLSTEPLASSMRNRFGGTVCSVREEGPNVWIEVDCGERLTAIISKVSYEELGLNLHHRVVASFKAHSVEVL